MKSEPDVYGIDHLIAAGGPAMWEGCRNYTVRNFFRDRFAAGDLALFSHSNANPSGLAGTMRVTSVAYADPTQFDPESHYYDPKSSPEAPRWLCVDVEFLEKFPRIVSLAEMRADPVLSGMETLRKGSRLSVTPLTDAEWERALELGRAAPAQG